MKTGYAVPGPPRVCHGGVKCERGALRVARHHHRPRSAAGLEFHVQQIVYELQIGAQDSGRKLISCISGINTVLSHNDVFAQYSISFLITQTPRPYPLWASFCGFIRPKNCTKNAKK